MNQNINQQQSNQNNYTPFPPNQMFQNPGGSFPAAVKKVPTDMYFKIIIGAVGLLVILFIASIILQVINTLIMRSAPGAIAVIVNMLSQLVTLGFYLFILGFFIAAIVLHFMLIYKMWAAINDGQSWTTPGKAIGFLFIPFVGFFYAIWNFIKYPEEYNNYVARHGLNIAPLSSGIFYIYGIISVIPFVGLLSPFILPFVLKQGFGAINNLADAIDNSSMPNVQKERSDMNIPQNRLPNLANG